MGHPRRIWAIADAIRQETQSSRNCTEDLKSTFGFYLELQLIWNAEKILKASPWPLSKRI